MKRIISVIIPSYNSARTITHTIDSLKRQKCEYLREIIVVDSSDDDDMQKVIDRYRPRGVEFINAGNRVMPARGRNMGASRASGDLLLFLDADVILKDDYIERIMDAYRNNIMVGCGGIEIPEFQINNTIVTAQYYLQLSEYIPTGEKRPKDILAGCNLFCDRKLFFEAGGFPDIRASEDVLFSKKISVISRPWFLSEAVVSHIFRADKQGYLNNQKLLGTYVGIFRADASSTLIYDGIIPIALMPLFFIYKLLLIVYRVVSAGGMHVWRCAGVMGMVLLGTLYWTIGMVEGSRRQRKKLKMQSSSE